MPLRGLLPWRFVVAWALSLTLGCEHTPAQSIEDSEEPTATAEPEERKTVRVGNAEGPLGCTLSGPAAPHAGEALELTLRVRRGVLASWVRVLVQLNLPAAATLERGELTQEILPGTEVVTVLHYQVSIGALPAQDLTVSVTAQGAGFGYRANLPYRFGRKVPHPTGPQRSAQGVHALGRNFGAAVPILRSR